MIKNYGFNEPEEIEDKEWKLGRAGKLYQPNGDWTKYLPKEEFQITKKGAETAGCTIWGTLNAKEILLKRIFNKEYNFSDRFNYNVAGLDLGGHDPHDSAQSIRHNRVIDEELLPMTDTYEEFIKPRPMTDELLNQASLFPYELVHWWIWTKNDKLTKDQRTALIRDSLKYSPICASVTAWRKKNGVYVDDGRPNTHWCVIFGEDKKGWKVFDSYDQTIKILSFDHNIRYAKGYDIIEKPAVRKVLMDKIKDLLKAIIKILTKRVENLMENKMKIKHEIIKRHVPNFWETNNPKAIVWHTLRGNLWGSISWLDYVKLSYNYIIAKDGKIYEQVPPDKGGYHAGIVYNPTKRARELFGYENPNKQSVGISFVRNGEIKLTDEQVVSARYMKKLLNLDVDIAHWEITAYKPKEVEGYIKQING